MPIRLLLADDHPLLLDGLEGLLGTQPDIELVGRCTDGTVALRRVEELEPDILVLDLRMLGASGADILRALRDRDLPTKVIVLTASADEDELFEAMRLGALGVVLKEAAPKLLIDAIHKVHGGGKWLERKLLSRAVEELQRRDAGARDAAQKLTDRELEVVRLLGEGLRNRQIADRLALAEGTVKVHLHNVYEKVGAKSRMALLRLAQDRGWI